MAGIGGRPALAAAAILIAFGLAGPARAVGLTDELGRAVSAPARPARIVSLAPNITEILFAVGAGGELAGVTAQCDYPPQARALPRVGGFSDPNLELIVSLRPDLVIATADGNPRALVDRLTELGKPVYVIRPMNLNQVLESIQRLGALTGHAAEAEVLTYKLQQRIAVVEAAVRGRFGPPRRLLVQLSEDPLIGAGPGTFVDDLLGRAGGANLLAGAATAWPVISLEQVAAGQPDAIISLAMQRQDAPLAFWRRIAPGLDAVARKAVYTTDPDLFTRPGPRLVDGLERLAALLDRIPARPAR